MNKIIRKCQFCGELYYFYTFSAADQSACPSCVRKAEARAEKQPLVVPAAPAEEET